MLNDISGIETWSKVSSGLLRLYEGEVLGKLPVVQHFVFGKLFQGELSMRTFTLFSNSILISLMWQYV